MRPRQRVDLRREPDRGDDWMDLAACYGMDTDLFHPTRYEADGGGLSRDARRAIAICQRCEVRATCLEYVMRIERDGPRQRAGIYGGLIPQQRTQLARRSA